jgi:hypothetical protein
VIRAFVVADLMRVFKKMKRISYLGTRRQLFVAIAATGAAGIQLLASAKNSAAEKHEHRDHEHEHGDPNCLLKGTLVSTPSGDKLVEELQIGDEITTLSGPKLIKWIGFNRYRKEDGREWVNSVMPIRVARLALDCDTPRRNLYLSPCHCILFNGALIPVRDIINQSSIAPAVPCDLSVLEYYHIELETHEVIFAEGAPVETYLDEGLNRENFSNFVEYERLYVTKRRPMEPFAPRVGYWNRRKKLKAALRGMVSRIVDIRDPIQMAHDQLAERARALVD